MMGASFVLVSTLVRARILDIRWTHLANLDLTY